MEDLPLISIVVPVYNVEQYLDECIRSILGQSYTNTEVILVDDGSADSSPLICDAWSLKDNRIRVFHQKNGGVSSARNFGIRKATGEYLVFIDADDVIDNRLLEILIKVHKASRAGISACAYQRFSTSWKTADTSSLSYRKLSRRRFVKARGGEYVWGSVYNLNTIRRHCLQFDENLKRHEETFWNTVYRVYQKSMIYVNEPLYFYRSNPHSVMHSDTGMDIGVKAWIRVKRAIRDWGKERHLPFLRRFELIRGSNHCRKNIYGECSAGNIPYEHYIDLISKEDPESFKISRLCYAFIISVIRLVNKIKNRSGE